MKRRAQSFSWIAPGFVVALVAGCAGTVSSTGPRNVRHVDPNQVSGPFAPAGQPLAIRLDQPIDTQATVRDQGFTAHTTSALRDAQGQILVPTNALVRGHVASTGSIDAPRVKLSFDSVDTVRGPAALAARVNEAQYRAYPGPVEFRPDPVPPGYYGSAYYPWAAWTYDGWGPVGGGPWGGGPWGGYNIEPYRPREVHLPAGAQLQLQLTRPLLPPGSALSR